MSSASRLRASLSALPLLMFCGAAFAQTAADGPAQGASTEAAAERTDEILVTAQRRVENVQDVPIAITALSAQALSESGVGGVESLQLAVPSFSFTQGVGAYALPRIRGVGTGSVGPGVENSVAMYVDGVYTTTTAGMLQFNNIEQLAVLKGPQGTLFGRNSTGGVVQVTTRDPGRRPSLDLELSAGDYQTSSANIYASTPLGDRAAIDLALYANNREDGFGVNQLTGSDVGAGHILALRSKFLLDASPRTSIRLMLDYSESDLSQPIIRLAEGTQTIFGGGLAGPGWDVNTTFDPTMQNIQYGAALRLDHDFGPFSFASISAYRVNDLNVRFDADTVPAPITDVAISQADEQFTQEFQILSPDNQALTWVLGLFYLDADGRLNPQRVFAGAPPHTRIRIDARQTTQSIAAFGQATLALAPSTNLTAGLRYTIEDREISTQNAVTLPSGVALPPTSGQDDASFDRLTWRLALDHRFSEQVLAYVSYNRGFKSGLFDPTALPTRLVQPEILDAYEIGLKLDVFDRRVRINAAAFHYEYENIQVVRVVNAVASLLNGAAATIDGLDVDATVLLTDRLSITAGLSLLDHRFTEFPDAIVTTPLPGGGNLVTSGSANGNRLPMTPDWTANLTLSYAMPTPIGELLFTGSYYYNDGYFEGPENRLAQEAYNLVNGSVRWTSPDGTWSASIWGRNLTDEFYANQLSAQAQRDAIVPGDPRTVGVSVGLHF